jgi:multidrug efflux pump subunit AcrA (membrane-fusion protein)
MNSRRLRIKALTAQVIAVFSIMVISSCGSRTENGEDAYVKLMKTAEVMEVSPVKQKQYPGTIEEAEKIGLAFRVAGPIRKIHVKEGDYVKKGQLVAEMDTRDYEIQVNAIEAQVIQCNPNIIAWKNCIRGKVSPKTIMKK